MRKVTPKEQRLAWIEKEILHKPYGEDWLCRDLKENWKESYLIPETQELSKRRKYSDHLETKASKLFDRNAWIKEHFLSETYEVRSEEEFKKLKSRWSTHKKRVNQKTISISLDRETHKKLKQLKGKHNLNETITAIIDSAYQAQTTQNLIPLKKITTPVLDLLKTGPNIFNESIEITEGIYKINLETINDIHRKTIMHAEKLAKLIHELSAINNKLTTRFKLN